MRVLRPTLLAMAICALCACSPAPTDSETTASAAPPPMEPVPAPVIGIDIAGMDTAVKPGDDFEAYANGGWRETAEIPADRASTGIFLQVFEKAEKRTADLVQSIIDGDPQPGSDERRIADYYTAFMDTAAIEARGLEPLQPQLDAIGAIADRTAFAKYLGEHLRADVDPLNATDLHTPHLFGLFVTQGLQDPEHNLPYLLQGGLGMPNRDYYLSGEAAMKDIRGKYREYVAALLEEADIEDAAAMADRVYALEEKIAKAQATVIETQDAHNAEAWAMDAFAGKAPGLDWATFFQAAGLQDQDTVIAWQPEAIAIEPRNAEDAVLELRTLIETADEYLVVVALPGVRPVVDVARPEAHGAVVAVLRARRVRRHVDTAVDAAERAWLCAGPMPRAAWIVRTAQRSGLQE